MRSGHLLAVFAVMLGSQGVQAQELPKTFACSFKAGAALAYAKGTFKGKRAQPLNLEIGSIDLEGQKAQMTTGSGKSSLRVVRALGANHYLEVVTEGYLTITTIYDRDERRGTYPAVHSRHTGLMGEPVIAQYTGFCSGK